LRRHVAFMLQGITKHFQWVQNARGGSMRHAMRHSPTAHAVRGQSLIAGSASVAGLKCVVARTAPLRTDPFSSVCTLERRRSGRLAPSKSVSSVASLVAAANAI